MLAKITNNETKTVTVALGNDTEYFLSEGFTEMEVEKAYNGQWYIAGFAPQASERIYAEKRVEEYPPIPEQLDMIYWDKVNNTNNWQTEINRIKTKYPKD